MQMSTQFVIKARNELRDLLLCDGGGEENIPDGQACKRLSVAGKQTMEEGRATTQVSQNEEWFFDRLGFVTRKENIIQEETKPNDQGPDGPDQKEKQQEFKSLERETRGRFFPGEERTIYHSPEEFEVVNHADQGSLPSLHKKSPFGLSLILFYQGLPIFVLTTGYGLSHLSTTAMPGFLPM